MSGIGGLWQLNQRLVEKGDLESVSNILEHRGRDGAGLWSQNTVGFVHRMLWTTPESLHEILPMWNEASGLAITADARIANRGELLHLLDFGGRKADDIADSEIIVAAYQEWGNQCPEKLIGDFAFVIWDSNRESLFCARDHIGNKPFYYIHQPHRLFAFASEIKGLLVIPGVPQELYEERIADYLLVNFDECSTTFYKSIFRLPPAHWLEVKNGQVSIQQYWRLDPTYELRLSSDDEYAEAFLECFTRVIESRLRTAYPIGSLLSGGLDSSTIVCVARKLLGNSREDSGYLHTFSGIFPNLPEIDRSKADETPFIEKVLNGGQLEPHFVTVDEHSPLEHTSELFERLDEPHIAPNLFMHWGIYQAAHEAGVRMLLDGFGGDSVISHGGMYLTELARNGQWQAFSNEAQSLAKLHHTSPWSYLQMHAFGYFTEMAYGGHWLSFLQNAQSLSEHFPVTRSNLILNYGVKPAMRQPYHSWKQRRQQLTGEPEPEGISILNSNFVRRIHYSTPNQIAIRKPLWTLREDQCAELKSPVISIALEEGNKATAALGIETTYPYFDRRLMEFCVSVPANQKLHDGWGRMYMRRALKGILPEEIRWRTSKGDLSSNFKRGFSQADAPIIEKTMKNIAALLGEYISIPLVQHVYERYLSNRNGVDELVLWKVVTLSLWIEKFLSNHVPG